MASCLDVLSDEQRDALVEGAKPMFAALSDPVVAREIVRGSIRAPDAARSVMVALLIGAVAEILWCIYLGLVLPPHYVADHWALAWIGLDIAEDRRCCSRRRGRRGANALC